MSDGTESKPQELIILIFFGFAAGVRTMIKTAKEIEYKLKSYLHHREFDVNPISLEEIKNIINADKTFHILYCYIGDVFYYA